MVGNQIKKVREFKETQYQSKEKKLTLIWDLSFIEKVTFQRIIGDRTKETFDIVY